jgi:hypothetical protein
VPFEVDGCQSLVAGCRCFVKPFLGGLLIRLFVRNALAFNLKKKNSDKRISKIALAWANVERRQRKRVLA